MSSPSQGVTGPPVSTVSRRLPTYLAVVVLAGAVYAALAVIPWHPDGVVRRATGIVGATLIFWITEVAPLGVTGLLIPVGATFAGVLKWSDALTAWGDPILFLFLGAFLLARALEKHGVFDVLVQARWTQRIRGGNGSLLAIVVMLVAGAISTMQSNTAVAAMMLPVVLALARTVRKPALVLLGLSYGATFGGMATPIGTPPNFIGYHAMKELDPSVNFLSWMRVGLPVWAGTTVLAWGLLSLVRFVPRLGRVRMTEAGVDLPDDPAPLPTSLPSSALQGRATLVRRTAQRWAIGAFAVTVVLWLGCGLIASITEPTNPLQLWIQRYLPESLPPILTAGLLFFVRVGPQRERVLEQRDFQSLDWDTLFLIAGGLCLGKMLQTSGAAKVLAATVGQTHLSPLAVMFGIGAVTVLLSELTSNTATAALMVPIAASLAPAVGMSPVQTTWLVALCASLGFALPVSTPPNAIVYGTRLVPLRMMASLGIIVDILGLTWVVFCVRWFA